MVRARCQTCSSKLRLLCGPLFAQISKWNAAAQHLQPYCRRIASSATNCHGQRKKVLAADDAAQFFGWNWSFASFTIQRPERYRCSLSRFFTDRTNGTRLPCVHSLNNAVCQGPVCSSSMMFSLFSLARAGRGALAVSDMSHKNCDRMESSWDLCPMILRIQKRRQRCRRRLLKSAPSQCERVQVRFWH